MLTNLYIDNFKALNDFNISFNKLTVLIGANSSGKSTILQAIDLMRAFVSTDLDTYFKERGWKYADIKSQLKSSRNNKITFKADFRIRVNSDIIPISWKFILNVTSDDISVDEESITDLVTERVLLFVSQKDIRINSYYDKNAVQSTSLLSISMKSSFLKIIDEEAYRASNPVIAALKKYIVSIDNFEALSPERIKSGNRGVVDNIGVGGERLFSYIKGLRSDKKKQLEEQLKKYMGNIVGIDAIIKGRPGWIDLVLRERFGNTETKIQSKYISDGLIRLVALVAIALMNNTQGIALLDEIEDGINPYIVSKVVDTLKSVIRETDRQIILSTHSAVMLNYFDAEDIVFIWRESDGHVKAKKLFDSIEMKKTLEYLNPGEVWLNYSQDRILEKLNTSK